MTISELTGRNEAELRAILRRACGQSPWPELHDPAVRVRALATAAAQGLADRCRPAIDPAAPIPVLRYTDFYDFWRTGNRSRHDAAIHDRMTRIERATLACFLGLDGWDVLHDLLWAECETSTWVFAAHAGHCTIDLSAAMRATEYARLLALFGDRLDERVRTRMREEIDRRVLAPFLAPRGQAHGWRRGPNNWNAVCNGGVGLAALALEHDPDRLAALLMPILDGLPCFLDGFADDGGCAEGPGYWRYGFGWYLRFADGLHAFTDGAIDLMGHPKIDRICRYPLAAAIVPGQELTFSDSGNGYLPITTACRINRYRPIPELFGLCRLRPDGQAVAEHLDDLLLYDGQPLAPWRDATDTCLPALGVAKVRMGAVTLGIKAGHNDEAHNHNDVGAFLVHGGHGQWLCDPGAPIYSANTFNAHRYESVFCNSFGHSVPVVNGRLQSTGGAFAGTMAVVGLNGGGTRRIEIEMARAYDDPTLERLTRVVTVPPAAGEIVLRDRFVFRTPPTAIEEAFLTTHPAAVIDGGAAVTITSPDDGILHLRAIDSPGRFRVDDLREASAESRDGALLRRIVFTPAAPAAALCLTFGLSPAAR